MDNSLKNGLKERQVINEEALIKRRRVQNLINIILNKYFHILTILVVILVSWLSYTYIINPQYQNIVKEINATFFEKNQIT